MKYLIVGILVSLLTLSGCALAEDQYRGVLSKLDRAVSDGGAALVEELAAANQQIEDLNQEIDSLKDELAALRAGGATVNSSGCLSTRLAVSTVTPASQTLAVSRSANIEAAFNLDVDPERVTADSFNVDGSISGKVSGVYAVSGSRVFFDPDTDFAIGETISVTLTTAIRSTQSDCLSHPFIWQFTVEVPQGYAYFVDNDQTTSTDFSLWAALGDVDGDDDLDAFITNHEVDRSGTPSPDKLWLNDGTGSFIDSGQLLGRLHGTAGIFGDLDGDGDLDVFVANFGEPNKVWLNDGSGRLIDSEQSLGRWNSRGAALGDLDGDGDLDAFVANGWGHPSKVWLNDGAGYFRDSGQFLDNPDCWSVALGDLDGDGDLDAFLGNVGENKVCLNDGSGHFSTTGQRFASSDSFAVSLGDLDGDGDLDAFVANSDEQPNRIWLNDGTATFSASDQIFGSFSSYGVSLGDLDGDGDLDAITFNETAGVAHTLWLNDGSGVFTGSDRSMAMLADVWRIAFGDLDGDGDLDAFAALHLQHDKVWLNSPAPDLPGDTIESLRAEIEHIKARIAELVRQIEELSRRLDALTGTSG